MIGPVTPTMVGQVVNTVCQNNRRDIRKVAGRLIEEVMEFAAKCGLSASDMRSHTEDSIHNMCLKESRALGVTVFPSDLKNMYEISGIVQEGGDVQLLFRDVLYLAGVETHQVETAATEKLRDVADNPLQYTSYSGSTFYKIKAHVTTLAPTTDKGQP